MTFHSQNKKNINTYFKIEEANPVKKNSDNYDDLYKVKSIHSNVNVSDLVKMQRKQKS